MLNTLPGPGLLCARWKALARGIAGARLLVESCIAAWLAYLDGVLVLEPLDDRCLFLCNAACCTAGAFVCSWMGWGSVEGSRVRLFRVSRGVAPPN